jgi:undecaprenyl-diphosphatase
VTGRTSPSPRLAQVRRSCPGVSRQGAVLTALRLQGVSRAPAARTSLLMSLPLTAGAALLPLARADRATLRELAPLVRAGLPAAALSGALSASAWRRRPAGSTTPAAVYRLGLAAAVAVRLRAARRA